MGRRRKHAQYYAAGCKVCGDPKVGRGIAKHLEGAHSLSHASYAKAFGSGEIVVDKLVETGTAAKGTKRVVIHVLVRRFKVPSR